MRTLIVYATNSGGAQAVSEIVADVLRRAGQAVTMQRASDDTIADFADFDLVILGSCTWERLEGPQMLDGQLQQHMYALTQRLAEKKWPGQQFAVYGLGDSSYTHFCAAASHLEKFVTQAKGRLVTPTLRIDGFFFDLPANRQRAHDWAVSLKTVRTRPKKSQ